MLRFVVYLVLVALLSAAMPAGAQDADESKVDAVREFNDAEYPAFIGAATTPTPEPETRTTTGDESEPDKEVTTMQRAMVLVADRASTTTWHQVRRRLGSDLEDLRLLLISNATEQEAAKQRDVFLTDLDMILVMAPVQAPQQELGLKHVRDRIGKHIEFLQQRLGEGELRLAETQDEMLRVSLEDFEQLLFQSDLDRGSPPGDAYSVPKDWNPGSFSAPKFGSLIQGWSGRKLLMAYEDRLDLISRDIDRGVYDNRRSAAEMGELARELATRLYEVPINSRRGFRDAALRLDVLAQSLSDYLTEGNRLYARRHARVTREAVQDVDAYLRLNEGRVAEREIP